MKNKILIKVYVPNIDDEFEVFIPSNESIKKIIDIIVKSINELSSNILSSKNYCLLDLETSKIYNFVKLVRNTNIRNGSKIILL